MIKRGKQEAKLYCISAWPLGTLKAETKAAKGRTADSGFCYNLSVLGKQLTTIPQIPSDEDITEVKLLTGPKIDCVSTITKWSPLVLSAKLEF